jgi:hypothetical protein
MILRRVIGHFRKQEWTAIFIDFVIVVLGVFLGMQVNNWNAQRAARANELDFLEAVSDDVRQEADNMRGYIATLNDVSKWGTRAGETLDAQESCDDDCWRSLVDFFLASQWVNVKADRAAYEEIRRTGLPRDRALKAELTRYYGLNEQVMVIFTELPEFREAVRSVIPAVVQDHLWRNCFRAEGRQQYFDENCPAPISENEARAVIEALRADPETRLSLNYWLSTVSVVRMTLKTQVVEAERTISVLASHIKSRK